MRPPLTLEQKAMICEDFIGNNMDSKQIAEKHNVCTGTVWAIIGKYLGNNDTRILVTFKPDE